jgi:tight adherence protein C
MTPLARSLILMIIFLGVFFVAFYLISGFFTAKAKSSRISQINSNRDGANQTTANKLLSYFSNSILAKMMKYSMPTEEEKHQEYKKKFIIAGIKDSKFIDNFFGFKSFATFVVPAGYLLFSLLFSKKMTAVDTLEVAVVLALIGYYLPNAYLNFRLKKRKEELFDIFPDALDLIRVCVSAGMGLDAAISRVGNEISVSSKAMSEEFNQLNLELRAGITRSVALQNLAIRTDLDEVKALVSMLIQAEKHGTSVSEALVIFSEDLRSKRKLRAQEMAAKIPVKMSLPVILCIFPSVFVILLASPALSVFKTFKF